MLDRAKHKNQYQPAGEQISEEQLQHWQHVSKWTAASDPVDINQGDRFVFLTSNANEIMQQRKVKVRYIFEGEDEEFPANMLSD